MDWAAACWPRQTRSAPPESWYWLKPLLALALAARIALALNTDSIVHPDEIFQYLEQGHRLAFGNGLIPWEYVYGMRSWMIPGFIALILKGLGLFGLQQPDVYVPAVKIVFCCISLVLPWSMYKITQALFDERAARLALIAGSFWYEILYFAHKPMPDALSAYALFAALVFLFRSPARGGQSGFGCLAALALVLRFQLAPMIAVSLLLAAIRWRRAVVWVLPGFLAIVFLAGALDAYSWGRWFSSIISNFEANFLAAAADQFGVQPIYFYLKCFVLTSFGLCLVGAAALLARRRQSWPLILIGLCGVSAFSVIGHKEFRFVFSLIPISLIGMAVFAAGLAAPVDSLRPWLERLLGLAARALPAAAAAVSLAGLFFVLPHEQAAYDVPLIARGDGMQAYLFVARQNDVAGVIDDSGISWWNSGGYYLLHHATPIYQADLMANGMQSVRLSPELYASHWLLPAAKAAPAGYVRIGRTGGLAIWRRRHDPGAHPVAAGFTIRTPIPDQIAIQPRVTARW